MQPQADEAQLGGRTFPPEVGEGTQQAGGGPRRPVADRLSLHNERPEALFGQKVGGGAGNDAAANEDDVGTGHRTHPSSTRSRGAKLASSRLMPASVRKATVTS